MQKPIPMAIPIPIPIPMATRQVDCFHASWVRRRPVNNCSENRMLKRAIGIGIGIENQDAKADTDGDTDSDSDADTDPGQVGGFHASPGAPEARERLLRNAG